VLDTWNVRYALVGSDSSLRSVLATSANWQEQYADSEAAVFSRRGPLRANVAASRPEARP